jgi:hypothetical protein
MRLAAAIIVIAACKEEPSPTRAGDGSSHFATPSIRCDVVVEKLKQAVVAEVDPAIAVLVSTKAPVVLSSCIYEPWPESLKDCVMKASASDLVAHRCDAFVSDELAQKLIDRLAPGQHISPRDFLQR